MLIRKMAKWTSLFATAMVLVLAALAAHTWYARPLFVEWFYAKSFLQFAMHEPELLTALRVLEPFGLRAHNAKLADSSLPADEERIALITKMRDQLAQYDAAGYRQQAAISYAVFARELEQRESELRWRWHTFPITQLGGAHTSLPALMIQQQRIDDVEDAENFITRLGALPLKMEQIAEQIRARQARGVIPPKFAVNKASVQVKEFIALGVEKNPLLKRFNEALEKWPVSLANDEVKRSLRARATVAVEAAVVPAYQKLDVALDALRALATKEDGAWSLPEGAAYYQAAIERHTSARVTADEIHALGLSEVARVGAEMDAVLSKIVPGEDSRAAKILRLSNDPARRYPDTDAGRAQVLVDYQTIIDEISPAMDRAFRLRPESRVVVKRVPTFYEKGSAAAYYESPPLDGSAPGVFYANLFDVNATPKHAMRTLAYHEAIPGHHFQTSIAQSLKDLPFFRSLVAFTAYDEGWALYAERLAWELGFQSDPHDNLGRLQDEMLRAVRLVVDTGIHAKRWSRETAIRYMVEQTGMVESEVVAEIERYFVDPGQALAYKVGMLKILELRERAKSALGPRFDIKDFHDVVLGNGSLPLSLLERVVDEYIARVQSKR